MPFPDGLSIREHLRKLRDNIKKKSKPPEAEDDNPMETLPEGAPKGAPISKFVTKRVEPEAEGNPFGKPDEPLGTGINTGRKK